MNSDDESEQIKPTLFQKIYYGKLRYPVYLVAAVACLAMSLAIVFGEFLIFQGITIQPFFKSCLKSMDYLTYLVRNSY